MSPLHLRGLAALFALYLGSCATMRAAGPGLIDCAAPLMSTLTADVLGQVGGAVRGEGFSGANVLDDMLVKLGPAVVCAAAKIATEGDALPQDAASGPNPARQQMAGRCASWLIERKFQLRGAP